MCIKRKYKIYRSKKKSLKYIRMWHVLPPYSSLLDDCDDPTPILLTVKLPLSVAQELAKHHGTALILDVIEGYLDDFTVLKVYSKEMAEDLVQNYGCRVVIRKWFLHGHEIHVHFFNSDVFIPLNHPWLKS